MRDQSVLNDDRIGRLLLKLSIPALIGMLVMTLYNVIDTIFISYKVGPLGIAGLSIVFPIQMLSLAIGQLAGIGGASPISRMIGANNIPRAGKVLGNAISIAVILSIVVSIAGLVNLDSLLRIMGASETILPYARDYSTIILFGFIFQTLSMTMGALVIAEGNARISMTGMVIGAVLNIIFCAIFVVALNMGVKGSALATVLAQLISVAFYLWHRFSGKGFLKLHMENLILEWAIIKEILAIGIASFIRILAESLPVVFINRELGLFGGDIAISTFGILNRLMMFALLPGIVIGQGLQPIVGFNFGSKNYDRVLKAIKIAIITAPICSVAAFAVLYFIPRPFIRIFTADVDIIKLAANGARDMFLAAYLLGFLGVGSTMFQALGKAIPSFITAIARSALFLIPLVLILPNFWQLDGVWRAYPITDALTCVLTIVLFIPQIRTLQKMNRAKVAEVGVEA
jgi:putative MATE family efflux protein